MCVSKLGNVECTCCPAIVAGHVGGGAAILFVITSVAEQTAPDFDSMIRDRLATIRFPYYYVYGFASLGIACLSAIGSCC